MSELSFLSYNCYRCDNIWHTLSTVSPYMAWHKRIIATAPPSGGCYSTRESPISFDDAMVIRHNKGGMSRERRLEWRPSNFLGAMNNSVMEFLPNEWPRYIGIGQYVFQGLSSWMGMRHRGA
ncbi:hypothetical protein NL676_014877 [Syzygium grande]|nr:hypothetical protein NL676_014877 [Syzygium grande]